MVAPGVFPLAKLGVLAIRQIAKPLANVIKNRAKASPIFRDYICMPPAQIYHWCEVNVKMRMLNLGKPREVRKLDQNAAIELGADLLGEIVIFTVGAVVLILEYSRQARNAAKAADEEADRWSNIESRLTELEILSNEQQLEIQDLTKKLFPKKPVKEIKQLPIANVTDMVIPIDSDSKSTIKVVEKDSISRAIEEATGKFTKTEKKQ